MSIFYTTYDNVISVGNPDSFFRSRSIWHFCCIFLLADKSIYSYNNNYNNINKMWNRRHLHLVLVLFFILIYTLTIYTICIEINGLWKTFRARQDFPNPAIGPLNYNEYQSKKYPYVTDDFHSIIYVLFTRHTFLLNINTSSTRHPDTYWCFD